MSEKVKSVEYRIVQDVLELMDSYAEADTTRKREDTRSGVENYISNTLAQIRREAFVEGYWRVINMVSTMKEPTPSANAHREYNRGVREGVELLRNHIIEKLKQDAQEGLETKE
jgi:hypothetical protein